MCAVGFAEDNRDITDKNGKKYAKYIKTNAAKLINIALDYPVLFSLMIREKLIAEKDLAKVTEAVHKSGEAKYISAIQVYAENFK